MKKDKEAEKDADKNLDDISPRKSTRTVWQMEDDDGTWVDVGADLHRKLISASV